MTNGICPNCGAQTNKPICEYCGSVVTTPQTPKRYKNDNEAIYVLPWPKKLHTDDDIIVKCLTHIRNMKDAPLDVFEHITDVQVTKYYLPMRYFNGNVTTDWNCIQVFDRKRIVGYDYDRDGKKKPIYEHYEEFIPASGKGAANFSFVVPIVSEVGLPKALVDCLGTMSLDKDIVEMAQSLDASLIVDGATIIDEGERAIDKTIIRAAEKYIGNVADRASFKNLSGRLQDCNFSYTWRYGSAQNKRLLVPASTVTYKYKGEQYTYAFIYNGDGFNGDSKKEYPKENNSLIEEVKEQSKRFTKTGWLTFGFSLILSVIILFTWGDLTPKFIRLSSIFGTIVLLITVAWKALGVSQKYDELVRHGEILSKIRRTDGLKKSFPQYANHKLLDTDEEDETKILTKIGHARKSIKRQRRIIKLFVVIQTLILIAGFINMNRINENKRAVYRAEQLKYIEKQKEYLRHEQKVQQQLEPIKELIYSELQGQTFTGRSLYGGKGLSITFLGDKKLQYRLSPNYHLYGESEWSSPKTIPYGIKVTEKSYEGSSWYDIEINGNSFYTEELSVWDKKVNITHFTIEYEGKTYSLSKDN